MLANYWIDHWSNDLSLPPISGSLSHSVLDLLVSQSSPSHPQSTNTIKLQMAFMVPPFSLGSYCQNATYSTRLLPTFLSFLPVSLTKNSNPPVFSSNIKLDWVRKTSLLPGNNGMKQHFTLKWFKQWGQKAKTDEFYSATRKTVAWR